MQYINFFSDSFSSLMHYVMNLN